MATFGAEFLETGEATLIHGCGGRTFHPPPPIIVY